MAYIDAGNYGGAGGMDPNWNDWGLEQFPLAQAEDPGRQKVQPVPTYQQPAQQPAAAAAPGGSSFAAPSYDTINAEYQKDLGRSARPDEYSSYWNTPSQGADWQTNYAQTIANSPEAQAYRQKQGSNSQGLLLDAVLQRLKQLQTPISAPYEDAYAKQALSRVDQLGGAPFTDQQSAALLTKNMEPLTHARDQAKQQAAQDLSRRGFGPTSGVFQQRMSQIDQAYQHGTAGVTNTLNIQGISQAQQNAQQQLQILDSLVQMGRMSRQEADQRSQQIVQTAGIPFQTDQSLLQSLNQSSGGDPSSAIAALLNLGGLNTRGTQIQNQQNGDTAQALGAFISYILSNFH